MCFAVVVVVVVVVWDRSNGLSPISISYDPMCAVFFETFLLDSLSQCAVQIAVVHCTDMRNLAYWNYPKCELRWCVIIIPVARKATASLSNAAS